MIDAGFVIQIASGTVLLCLAVAIVRRSRWLRPLSLASDKRRAAMVSATVFGMAAAGLLVGLMVPFAVFFAGVLGAVAALLFWTLPTLMCGNRTSALASLLLAVASAAAALLQPLGLRVVLLPRADPLAYAPVHADVIKTYAEGVSLESVRVDRDGSLYLSANRDLDFSSPAYYRRARGYIIARSPHGRERTLFTTPIGMTAGGIAIGQDGSLYVASHGARPGIWRVSRSSEARLIARLPAGAWPNGLEFGPDGKLYAADSALAVIWRIDPASGRYEEAIRDEALAARKFVALAPGANGLHFRGWEMIVTVSDATTVLAYDLAPDGRFGGPRRLATGIPGDDFAIGPDGSLYITTHPYDTVVRRGPDGRRSVIANAGQQMVGPTDAVFGRGADANTLYVVTDGGAFTRGAKARGQLIALRLGGDA